MSITKLNVGNIVTQLGGHFTGAGELFTTGNIYYVSSTSGSNQNLGTDPAYPLATIAQAQSSATASQGDIVVIMPGHTETLTAALTLSKAGVSYVGIGSGSTKPSITVNAAVNGVSITGNGVVFANVHFTAPSTNLASSMVSVTGTDVKLLNIDGIPSGSSKTFVDCIRVGAVANDLLIDGAEFYHSVASAVNSHISFGSGTAARTRIFNSFFIGQVASAGIYGVGLLSQLHFKDLSVHVTGSTKPAISFTGLGAGSTGMIERAFFSGTSSTTAAVAAFGTGVVLNEVKANIATDGSAQGVYQPLAQQ